MRSNSIKIPVSLDSNSSTVGEGPLPRRIGLGTAIAVVIGSMVGSGIFTTTGFISRDVGSPIALMALWVAGGLTALAGALCYSELGGAMPEAGGDYVYLREAFGPFVAYLSGWTSFLVGFSGATAASALAFVGYLRYFFPTLDSAGFESKLLALAILWSLTGVHVAGVGPGGKFQRFFAATTVLGMLALIAAGFSSGRGNAHNFLTAAPAQGSAAVALIFVMYAYSGWNAAAYLAGEIQNPSRRLPAALITGTTVVIVLYLGMNAMYLYAQPTAEMAGVLAVAEKTSVTLLGPTAAGLIAGLVAIVLVGSTSALILSGPRVYYAMARDGVFFRSLSKLNPKLGTPARAILLQAAWASVLILFFHAFERVVVYTGFALTAFTALTVIALIVLRVRRPTVARPFLTPGYPWLPSAYLVVSAWILTYTLVQ